MHRGACGGWVECKKVIFAAPANGASTAAGMGRAAECGIFSRSITRQPLVFGHYSEINNTLSALIESLGRAIAARHHRPFGWKNANAGISRARAGVMRRISMAILRATAQHLLSGLHHRAAVRLRERGTPPPEALLKSCSRIELAVLTSRLQMFYCSICTMFSPCAPVTCGSFSEDRAQ